MRAYIMRRIALFIPTAFGVSVFIFLMLHVIPGDYATTLLLGGRDRALVATEEDFDRWRAIVDGMRDDPGAIAALAFGEALGVKP